MRQEIKILNPSKEKLDILIEGNNASPITIIMVHGLGVDKHETAGMFDDIAAALVDTYRVVRFDFSGFGKSEGRTEDFNYIKHADDLNAVLTYVNITYTGTVYILAQSMGTFVTSLLCPTGITKTVFTGIPNSNTEYIIERIVKRFGAKSGAFINQEGISTIPRSSGAVQKWGPSFWKILREYKPVDAVSRLSKKTKLYIIHPLQDEVVGPEYQKEYDAIANVKIEWINGDHSFKKPADRTVLIEKIKQFFA